MSINESRLKVVDNRRVKGTVSDFFALLKPRVMALAIFTAFVGLVAAPGVTSPTIAMIAIAAISVGAGAAGALNMWYDADIDAIMPRTAHRPVASGRVLPGEALGFGLALSVLSVMTLGVMVNWLAAALLAFTIFFYVVVYTMWLKRTTPQNIVIGGAAGALPPMIGWAAASGAIGVESAILFLIIFLWTPPHFWALALFKAGDYAAAGIPMMPNVAGRASTCRQIFVYSLLLALVGILPWAAGFASLAYGLVATLFGAGFIWHAWKLLAAPGTDMKCAKALFSYSILYLFVVFATLLVDTIVARALAPASG